MLLRRAAYKWQYIAVIATFLVLYVSESIDAVQPHKFDTIFSDGVFCMLTLPETKLIVGVCYRSPTSTCDNDEAMLSLFESVSDSAKNHNCVIMGVLTCRMWISQLSQCMEVAIHIPKKCMIVCWITTGPSM